MTAVILGLASGLTWGFGDFLGGIQSRRRGVLTVLVVSQAAGLGVMAIAVAVRGDGPPPGAGWIAWAAGASVFGIAALGAFYRGLAIGAMGVVAPISSAAAIIPLVVGLASGERPGAVQLGGIALALIGVILTSREVPLDHGTRPARAAGTWLAIAAAVGFGLFFVGLDEASRDDALWPVLVARVVSVGVLVPLALALRAAIPTGPADLRALVPIGVLDTTANLLFALATREGLVSVVAVLGSLYPVVTVILARLVLHERLHTLQRAGAVAALAGAALISTG